VSPDRFRPFGSVSRSSRPTTPFPLPAHRTERADFPHPALGPGSFRRHARRLSLTRLACRYSFRCSVWIFSGVARLIANRLHSVLLRPRPGTRAPSLHRHYPASSVLRAPPPPAPASRPMRLLARPTWPPKRASRVAHHSLLACCHPPPRRSGPGTSSSTSRSVAAFPQSRQGRPSHRVFRGRLGVHACYGLPTRRQPEAASFLPGFGRFVTSTTAGIATRPGRPLPGQDFHLLEQRTFHGTRGPLQWVYLGTEVLPKNLERLSGQAGDNARERLDLPDIGTH